MRSADGRRISDRPGGAPGAVTLLCGLLAIGCGAEEAPVSEAVVGEGLESWPVNAEPHIVIGGLEASEDEALFNVAGSAVLPDGSIVVANTGSLELRYYDREGRHSRSVGGQGGGPGEFRHLVFGGVFGDDSVLVVDPLQRVATVFDAAGAIARTVYLDEELGRSPNIEGVLGDGRLIASPRVQPSTPSPAAWNESRVERPARKVAVIGTDGSVGPLLGEYPGDEWYRSSSLRAMAPVVFGHRLLVAGSGDRIAVGSSEAFRIEVRDSEGGLRHVIEQDREPLPVGRGDFVAMVEEGLKPHDDEGFRARMMQVHEEMPRKDHLPAFESIVVDSEGHVWVREFTLPDEEHARWQVFDPAGVPVATVDLPSALQVHQIGPDFILGMARGEHDVEEVRLYGLTRT